MAFNEHKNAKGIKCQLLVMFQLCCCCLDFLQGTCLFNTGLDHSRSYLVFEILNNLFSECSIESFVLILGKSAIFNQCFVAMLLKHQILVHSV